MRTFFVYDPDGILVQFDQGTGRARGFVQSPNP